MASEASFPIWLITLGLLAGLPAQATGFLDPRALQEDPAQASAPLAPVLTGLGNHAHPVTTGSESSQRFFDQGLRLVFAFNHSEAIRAFQEAIRLDPGNAMAYWGWALALGPNLNLPMQPEAIAPAARAIARALALSDQVSPAERAYIQALATRYSADPAADRAALDQQYAQAMASLAKAYPGDMDAVTLYADALMNLSPWNYWYPDGTPREGTPVIVATLGRVLAADPGHPGALHLHIHAMEAVAPREAEPSADRLLQAMPGSGHLVHMPSHIYMRVGRFADAYQANQRAIEADERYIEQCRAQGIYPLLYYPHNIHFMVWAAMLEGRSAVALADARRIAGYSQPHRGHSVPGLDEHFLNQPVYTLIRFGRWRDMLREPAPPADARFMTATWHFGRGLAFRYTDEVLKAERELAQLRAIATEPVLQTALIGFAPAPALLAIADGILAGEIALARGRTDAGIGHLTRAVTLQDALPYNEPPDWFFPARHYLGAALLDAGRPDEAAAAYWRDLERNPGNGFALFGLTQALSQPAGGPTHPDSEAVGARFRQAWRNADVELTSSRF